LDLKDGGMPFDCLEQRTVALHSGRFSPANAMLQWKSGATVASFFSVAQCNGKTIVCLHILPRTKGVDQLLKAATEQSNTTNDLVTSITTFDAKAGKKLQRFLTVNQCAGTKN